MRFEAKRTEEEINALSDQAEEIIENAGDYPEVMVATADTVLDIIAWLGGSNIEVL